MVTVRNKKIPFGKLADWGKRIFLPEKNVLSEKNKPTLTICTIDIRKFSLVASINDIEDIKFFINQYITLIGLLPKKIKARRNTVIDSFLGDGFLIFCEDNLDAIKMALKLRTDFKGLIHELNGRINKIGRLGIGVGIHRGEIYYDTFGYKSLNFHTGIGHHVNMAFRLVQGATKWEILASEEVWRGIDIKTINTCKDKVFPKGAIDAIWPYSILGLSSRDGRKCCDKCERFKFCEFNWKMGNQEKEIDPFFLVPENRDKIKYKLTAKMLCALPSPKVIPDKIMSLEEGEEKGICGECDPVWKVEVPQEKQIEPIRHCVLNLFRGYHGIGDRECCDDCKRFSTCLFNRHRGKNGQSLVLLR